jgi:uncharacterized repeat protein (TIGR02543 family)
MASNKNVVANFTPIGTNQFCLTTNVSPAGAGTVTGGGNYNSGSTVTVSVTVNSGYTFTGWSGDASGTNSSVTIVMSSNKSVTANFTANTTGTYSLTVSASPSNGGSVTGAGTYNSGSTATLSATANSGYAFTGWSGDANGSSNTASVVMNGNKNVVANFTAISSSGKAKLILHISGKYPNGAGSMELDMSNQTASQLWGINSYPIGNASITDIRWLDGQNPPNNIVVSGTAFVAGQQKYSWNVNVGNISALFKFNANLWSGFTITSPLTALPNATAGWGNPDNIDFQVEYQGTLTAIGKSQDGTWQVAWPQ